MVSAMWGYGDRGPLLITKKQAAICMTAVTNSGSCYLSHKRAIEQLCSRTNAQGLRLLLGLPQGPHLLGNALGRGFEVGALLEKVRRCSWLSTGILICSSKTQRSVCSQEGAEQVSSIPPPSQSSCLYQLESVVCIVLYLQFPC